MWKLASTSCVFLTHTKHLKMHIYLTVQRQPRVNRISAMSLQVCPAMNLKSGQHIESACHIPDARSNYRCLTDEDCGVDATTCRPRSCSIAGYCGLWLII